MDSEVRIRDGTPADCLAISRLNREEMGYDHSPEETRSAIEAILADRGQKLLVAEVGGEVAGYLHANTHQYTYGAPLKNIMGVAVAKACKRKGIGRQLLEAAEAWAKEDGAAGVRLVSGSGRTAAHAFYQACGYQLRKTQMNFRKFF